MVVWTVSAKQDLKRIFDFIANDSRYYAEDVIGRIVELSVGLDRLPGKGRVVPEKGDPIYAKYFCIRTELFIR